MEVLAVIPARGGSKGIPRKNVRLLAGKPLIAYTIEVAKNSAYSIDICVSTDDDEISRVSKSYGIEVVKRNPTLAKDDITLDPVIFDAFSQMKSKRNKTYDLVVTIQPTSPLLTTRTLDKAIESFIKGKHDTIISVTNNPHLFWNKTDLGYRPGYIERLNRQYLPKHLMETGAFLITRSENMKKNSRIGSNISVFEVPSRESIDIDTPQDWWIAEKELLKKKIIIRVEGYSEIGLGHIYRTLTLAYHLIDHEIHFIISKESVIGIEKLKKSHFPMTIIDDEKQLEDFIRLWKPDIIINDILDTTTEYIESLKKFKIRIINFEDLGNGGFLADAVINDLYAPRNKRENFYWGSNYYIIRDEFVINQPEKFNKVVKNILVIFGGTDPNNLTTKLLHSITKLETKNIHFTFIIGPGNPHYDSLLKKTKTLKMPIKIVKDVKVMSEYMKAADLAISSQGRTMLELASLGVPTILLAQNEREVNHEFGYLNNGFINLGLGKIMEEKTISETIEWLIKSPQVRFEMRQQMLKKDLRSGLSKVMQIILGNEEK